MTKRMINLRNLANEHLGIIEELSTDLIGGVERGLIRSIPDLVEDSPVDTGQYASNWKVERFDTHVFLMNLAPHAAIIEYGARPFTPPIAPLLAWAKRVLQDPKTPQNPSDPNEYSPAVRGLAYAVQKKISIEGIKPRHVVENNMDNILENIISEWKGMTDG